MQFSTKIDGFEQKDSQGFENSYNSYEQYPLEKFFIFTIYQNYTLALREKSCSGKNRNKNEVTNLTQRKKLLIFDRSSLGVSDKTMASQPWGLGLESCTQRHFILIA